MYVCSWVWVLVCLLVRTCNISRFPWLSCFLRGFLVWTGAFGMLWARWQTFHVCTPQCQSMWAARKPLVGAVWDKKNLMAYEDSVHISYFPFQLQVLPIKCWFKYASFSDVVKPLKVGRSATSLLKSYSFQIKVSQISCYISSDGLISQYSPIEAWQITDGKVAGEAFRSFCWSWVGSFPAGTGQTEAHSKSDRK